METKSRYEVISDLEKQKRELINKRDELEFEVKTKERSVLTLKRSKEDTAKLQREFETKQENKQEDLNRETRDWNFKMSNTIADYDRKIIDAEQDIVNFKETILPRKTTFNELIKGIDESLERFGKLQTK